MSFRCDARYSSAGDQSRCILPTGHAGAHVAYSTDEARVLTWMPGAVTAALEAAATLDEMLVHHADLVELLESEGFVRYAAIMRRELERIHKFRAQFDRRDPRPPVRASRLEH